MYCTVLAPYWTFPRFSGEAIKCNIPTVIQFLLRPLWRWIPNWQLRNGINLLGVSVKFDRTCIEPHFLCETLFHASVAGRHDRVAVKQLVWVMGFNRADSWSQQLYSSAFGVVKLSSLFGLDRYRCVRAYMWDSVRLIDSWHCTFLCVCRWPHAARPTSSSTLSGGSTTALW